MALVLGVVLTGAAFAALEPAGKVVALEGTASAMNQEGARRALAIQSPIFPLDTINTAESSKLQIMFSDDSLVSQGEKSELTIDEYVYDPNKKSRNRARLGITKGLFRVVTDKITKLNPKRFNVKTRMATIGIRGCDVGFKILPDEEDIYVIGLHGTEQVSVASTVLPSGSGRWSIFRFGRKKGAGGADILIDESRKMVLLRKGKTIQVLELPADLLARFLNAVEVGLGLSQLGFDGEDPPDDDLLAWLSSFIPKAGATPPPGPPPPPGLEPPDPPPPPPPPEPEEEEEEEEEEPRERFIEMGRSAHDHWVWGRWERDGKQKRYAFDSTSPVDGLFTPFPIDAMAFKTMITEGGYYYLTTGEEANFAAATVLHDGETIGLVGTCSIAVDITPEGLYWNGSFDMDNNDLGDSLSFEAGGNVGLDGSLQGTISDDPGPSLSVHGYTPEPPPDSASIDGMLAGEATDVTGAFGWFELTFPEADIDGIFATDLGLPEETPQ